ncbi:MAG: ribonuclease E activity regulator RraA [Neomegalonema sp.]|nr:ribonuclease E activity regulator RraA [Neomegalonema sp.]
MTSLATTDLHDAFPNDLHQCQLQFKDFGKKAQFSGRIRTIVTMHDTKLAQSLFREPGNGQVVVIDCGGSLRTAMLGDINAEILRKNGWAGVIINGAVRDSAALAKIDIGIKALGVTSIRSAKNAIGATDVPVAFGEVLFTPGLFVYCDSDAVLVSAKDLSSLGAG